MITQRMSLRTEVIYSDDLTHRYRMRKEWDKNKTKATIIMINPSSATEIEIDQTTMNVINNLNRLGYGAVDITNPCSLISPKMSDRLFFLLILIVIVLMVEVTATMDTISSEDYIL